MLQLRPNCECCNTDLAGDSHRGFHLLVRMHVLRTLRERDSRGQMPELWRRAVAAPAARA
jgi:hypothetical protein